VENGVCSLFPPLDGKTMGYKEEEERQVSCNEM
jgi:hypothetical protein